MNEHRSRVNISNRFRRRAVMATIALFSFATLSPAHAMTDESITSAVAAPVPPTTAAQDETPAQKQSPLAAPSSVRKSAGGRGGEEPREGGRHWLPGISATLPTEEEWAEIRSFMEEHSKVRWTLAQQSLSQPGRSDLPRRVIFAQYLELKKLQNSDPAEFKQRVGQIELEDEIFHAETLLREAEAKQSADVSDLRTAFEAKVKEHYDRELDAKEARIGRLESQLRQQREALESERQKSSQTLQQRIEVARKLSDWFRSWANGNIRLPYPRRPGPRPDDAPPADPTSVPDATPGKE